MDTRFKDIIAAFVGIIMLAIIIVPNLPKPKLTLMDRMEIGKFIENQNADLPRKIGTIGWLNEIKFDDMSLIYQMSVDGDVAIDMVYENNYELFRTLFLYSIVTMNGQNDCGTLLAQSLDAKDINLKYIITTPSKRRFEWILSPSEMITFIDSYKAKPTEAMFAVLEMEVKLVKQQLPAVINAGDNIQTTSTNAISVITCNYDDILLDIRHIENNIELYILTSEQENSLSDIVNDVDDEQFLSGLTAILAQSDDFRELLNELAISHSNLVIHYEGQKSKRQVRIKIPYSIIREYCDVPQELLSVN